MLSFPPSPQVRVFVARHPLDMRKSIDGLAAAVIDVIDHDPQSGHLFLFFNKRRDRFKVLIWEASGYWLLYKRIEHGRFHIFDRVGDHDARFEVSSSEFALITDGIDLRGAKKRITHDELHTQT